MAGFMNMIGWLADTRDGLKAVPYRYLRGATAGFYGRRRSLDRPGGGSAPLVIGVIAQRASLDVAMALASLVYLAAGLLIVGMIYLASARAVVAHPVAAAETH